MPLKTISLSILGVCILGIVIQLIPVRKDNPPVLADLSAPEEVHKIFKRSCYDCHSHETRWPWYSKIAPVSWLVASDVSEGREYLNFSTWGDLSGEDQDELKAEIQKKVSQGEMPPFIYRLGHPDAKPSGSEKEIVQKWSLSK